MIFVATLLGLAGLLLSALFSGSETGFYRVTRVRLLLDALAGDFVSRGLSWLTTHPQLFVATTLIGNNVANYVTSLATVMAADALLGQPGTLAQIVTPLVIAPILFVYGELLPKYLFHEAPNRLLRRVGPLLLTFTVLFLPLSALLWAVGRVLERLVGESPQGVQLTLAREHLEQVFEEGHELGVLRPAQRQLALGLFAVAGRSVLTFSTPVSRLSPVNLSMSKDHALRLAARQRMTMLPVQDSTSARNFVGYVRVADLRISPSGNIAPLRPLIAVSDRETHIRALMRLHDSGESMARIVDAADRTVGIVTADALREPLFRGGR